MMADKPLQDLLNAPRADAALAQRIRDNWRRQQRIAARDGTARFWLYGAGMAAVALFGVLLLWPWLHPSPPLLVVSARLDIDKDAGLHGGLSAPMQDWLTAHAIAPPPAEDRVEMAKFCNLSGYLNAHLRIAGARQGHAHVFIYPGSLPFDNAHDGRVDGMRWETWRMGNAMSVLVLYDKKMRRQGVERILQAMFPRLAPRLAERLSVQVFSRPLPDGFVITKQEKNS